MLKEVLTNQKPVKKDNGNNRIDATDMIDTLSVSNITLLHEWLGTIIDKLKKHDPTVIKELRQKGYNTEAETTSDHGPISKYRSPI